MMGITVFDDESGLQLRGQRQVLPGVESVLPPQIVHIDEASVSEAVFRY